jgi:hypothetical protein
MAKPNQDLPDEAKKPVEPYTAPGESKAGRGGIVSPGGTQPKPTEDPRKDAGLEEDPTVEHHD